MGTKVCRTFSICLIESVYSLFIPGSTSSSLVLAVYSPMTLHGSKLRIRVRYETVHKNKFLIRN